MTEYSKVVLAIAILLLTSLSFCLIAEDNPIIIEDIIQVQETCDLNNGKITIIIQGNPPGLEYSIDGGLSYSSNNHFENLPSSDYLIIVTDGALCTEVYTAQIADAGFPEIEIELVSECVTGLNRAVITPMVEGGSKPYQYEWKGPNGSSYSSETIEEAPPGDYFLTITDNLGCSFSDNISVSQCCSLNLACNLEDENYECVDNIPSRDPLLSDPTTSESTKNDLLKTLGISLEPGACGPIKIEVVDTPNIPTECDNDTLKVVREYIISDAYNDIRCTQLFSVPNYIKASIQQEAENTAVSCDINVDDAFQSWLADKGGMIYQACSDPIVITTIPAVPILDARCGVDNLVTFIIEDNCGNVAESSAIFSVTDNTAPIVSCPNDLTVSAIDDDLQNILTDWLSKAEGADNCGVKNVQNDFDPNMISTDCEDAPTIDVNFSVENNCGLEDFCSATITVINPGNAVLTCGDDLFLSCDADIDEEVIAWLDDFYGATGQGEPLILDIDLDIEAIKELSCNELSEAEFSMVDECDRQQSCVKTVHIIDNLEPELSCPTTLTIPASQQDASSIVQSWLDSASAEDNCSTGLTVSNDFVADLSDLCVIQQPIEVSFVVSDNCENTSVCKSSIEILHQLPSLTCPEDLIIECGTEEIENLLTAWAEGAIATQNDDNPVTNTLDGDFSSITCSETQLVVFTSLNNCGNGSDCSASISIKDEQAPELSCPPEMQFDIFDPNLSGNIEEWLDSAYATDCNSVDLINDLELDLDAVTCTESFPLNFLAMDLCGLTSSCTTSLSIINDATIEITCPEEITLVCTDPRLESAIENHLELISVSTQNKYEVFQDLDESLIDFSCEDPRKIEVDISAIDICDNEVTCRTAINIIPDPAIYVPNVFSPDGDGLEDWFTAYTNSSVEIISSMTIYNRWGSKVFEKFDFEPNISSEGWDGTYRGQNSEVFTYYIVCEDTLGSEMEKVGTVQILKK